ncbi:MAG TPA: hypothetical protein VK974_07215 [Methylophilaceae bacterium]|nr:hypothetical protein [Methylophilaceae bacterium]
MKTIEYLDECKKKLNITSNYALAKHIDVPEQRVHDYYKGRNGPDDYACFKIAECIGIDPAIVIAEIRSETETSEKKREYFKVFRGASRKAGVVIILALALSLSLLNAPEVGDHSGSVATVLGGLVFLYRRYFA